MKKHYIFSLICVLSISINAQTKFETQLDSIQDESQATAFIESNKSNKGQIITFNKEKHNTKLAKDLFKLSNGGKKVFKTDVEQTYYKVIQKNEVPHYRVSYIFLDGSKKSMEEITKTRADIINKYKEGFQFKDLAKRYSMDDNANRGGDLGWFRIGDLHPEFENAIVNNSSVVDDIFEVDVAEKLWYYVVLKTHDTKMIEEIKVLKVTEPIN